MQVAARIQIAARWRRHFVQPHRRVKLTGNAGFQPARSGNLSALSEDSFHEHVRR
jgi:hypothetical protein